MTQNTKIIWTSFMNEALKQAEKAYTQEEVPVGAVLVYRNRILARAHNQVRALKDPTAHAEIIVLRKACQILDSSQIPSCDIYVTLEPCAMCACAISLAHIRRLYYAVHDEKRGAVESVMHLFETRAAFYKTEAYEDISSPTTSNLLRSFFQTKR